MSVTTGSIAAALLGERPGLVPTLPVARPVFAARSAFGRCAQQLCKKGLVAVAQRASLCFACCLLHKLSPATLVRRPTAAQHPQRGVLSLCPAGVAGHAHKHWGSEFTSRAIAVRVLALVSSRASHATLLQCMNASAELTEGRWQEGAPDHRPTGHATKLVLLVAGRACSHMLHLGSPFHFVPVTISVNKPVPPYYAGDDAHLHFHGHLRCVQLQEAGGHAYVSSRAGWVGWAVWVCVGGQVGGGGWGVGRGLPDALSLPPCCLNARVLIERRALPGLRPPNAPATTTQTHAHTQTKAHHGPRPRSRCCSQKLDGPYDSRVLPVVLTVVLMTFLSIVFVGSLASYA